MVHRRADLHPCIGPRLPDARLHQAVEFILSRQNPDHGFGIFPTWALAAASTESD